MTFYRKDYEMTPVPVTLENLRQLSEPCIGYVSCASAETAAMNFKAHYGEEPRAIYSYVNRITGHTSYYIPKATCDERHGR